MSCLEIEPRAPSASTVSGAWISTPGVKFGPGSPLLPRPAVAPPPQVAEAHPLARARLIKERRRGGEARKDLAPERFGLGREPGCELSERDDVVAVVVERRGIRHREWQQPHQPVRHR